MSFTEIKVQLMSNNITKSGEVTKIPFVEANRMIITNAYALSAQQMFKNTTKRNNN